MESEVVLDARCPSLVIMGRGKGSAVGGRGLAESRGGD